MIVDNLSPESLNKMPRVDLVTVSEEPPSPIGYFDLHECQCGIASSVGRPPIELHAAGDELLHVLSGECRLVVGDDGKSSRLLRARRPGHRPARLLARQRRAIRDDNAVHDRTSRWGPSRRTERS